MDARIVKVGNSRGVRIPRPLLEEAGLGERVSLRVVDEGILIEPQAEVRLGWAEAGRFNRESGGAPAPADGHWPATRFDLDEWEWETEGDNA